MDPGAGSRLLPNNWESAPGLHLYWDTVGEAVRSAALNFLNHGQFDSSINSTYVVLIPKSSSADSVNDYRPISLCKVLYKIIAKSAGQKAQGGPAFYHISTSECLCSKKVSIWQHFGCLWGLTHYGSTHEGEEWLCGHQIGYDKSLRSSWMSIPTGGNV
jgi:hypothetical protein